MEIDFSVIIPHRESIHSLKRLFDSIPPNPKIEILLVDNSPVPISKNDIGINREYQLYWAEPARCAGGARNVGLDNARGKWLIFADADDFFAINAFDLFYSHYSSKADVIYFCVNSIYIDTGEPGTRGDVYTNMVRNYEKGNIKEEQIRFGYGVPWGKMVRKSLVDENNLRFDEVVASNDFYFSLLSGYYAKTIEAYNEFVYVVTTSRGSLTKRRDLAVVESRLLVALRSNLFLREQGYSEYQQSIMLYLKQTISYGFKPLLRSISNLIKYRQNPLVGWKNWIKTVGNNRRQESKDSQYITK